MTRRAQLSLVPPADAAPAHDARLDNSPNARKLLESLRYLGYETHYAISDLVDNAIDAEAENVWVRVERLPDGDVAVVVADDGAGMDAAALDQASRLGSESARDAASDLGRFGMGLVTASLSLGKRLTIVTRRAGGPVLANVTDIDHMTAKNRFERDFFGPLAGGAGAAVGTAAAHTRAADPAGLAALYTAHLRNAAAGTVVRITKCDRFKRHYLGPFEKDLIKRLGQTYRVFIRAGRKLHVNDEPVPVNDPLWLGDPDDRGGETATASVYSDDSYELRYTGADGREVRDSVRARLVILPDHGGPKENSKKNYKVEKSGFYVLRNNREIAEAQLLGLEGLRRHPDFIRFRAELFVSGRLDEGFGIEFTKRDVKPAQSIRDQLDKHLAATIKSLRGQLQKKAARQSAEGVDHGSSEQFINKQANLLVKPPARGQPELEAASTTPLGAVKFRLGAFGREGPVYAAEQKGRTTFVDWNVDHPFYEKVVVALRDEREKLNAVDALIFCMAAAELRVFDDDQQAFIESWKSIVAMNLRVLLS